MVAAWNGLDIATLEVKRILNLPANQPLVLTSSLDSPDATIPVVATDSLDGPARPGLAAADATVRVEQELLKVARADRWPTLSVTTPYNQPTVPDQRRPRGRPILSGLER